MGKNATKILEAHWESYDRGVIYLDKDWIRLNALPPLYLNPGKQPLRSLSKAPPTVFAKRSGYYFDLNGNITFLLWPHHLHNLESDTHVFYVAGDFNGWSEAVGDRYWQMKLISLNERDCFQLTVPIESVLKGEGNSFKFVTARGKWLDVPTDAPNRKKGSNGAWNYCISKSRTGHHVFYFSPQHSHLLFENTELLWSTRRKEDVFTIASGDLLSRLYTDSRLGVFIEEESTVFRIFAPRATEVKVIVSKHLNSDDVLVFNLVRTNKMVWEKVCPKNLNRYFYHYHIDGHNHNNFSHFDPQIKVLDPYALAAVSREGPGIIIDANDLPQVVTPYQPPAWHDLIILETHVRDLLAHAPADLTDEERLGFSGLAKWLRSGKSYLTELGINAVELQPIQEFDNQSRDEYHWGYMACNYFSPESTYGTAPEKASQITEFKDLVDAFHENNIAVILDVVYNHLGEPNPLLFIDKHYYLETDNDGNLSNWSGCGNDLKCHAPMSKRLIIDSLLHLIHTYDVDGFRFDLAELIGVDVLRDIESALKAAKPSIILIAEPWSFRGHIAHALRHTGWSSWNDGYRDFVMSYVKGEGNWDGIRYFMSGSPHYFAKFPAQTVNYTESHDDRCWIDRVTEQPDFDGNRPTQNDRRRTHLMCAILLSSLGVPMLAEGQDMLRSKFGINNTYQRGDINALNYERQQEYPVTYQYFRCFIRFRLSEVGRLWRLASRPSKQYMRYNQAEDSSAIGILYNADNSLGLSQIYFAVNPNDSPVAIPLEGIELKLFVQIADHERFSEAGLDGGVFRISNDCLHLSGLSCGVWVKKK